MVRMSDAHAREGHCSPFHQDGIAFKPRQRFPAAVLSQADVERPGLKYEKSTACVQCPFDILRILVMSFNAQCIIGQRLNLLVTEAGRGL